MNGYAKGLQQYRSALADVDAARQAWPEVRSLLERTLNAIGSEERVAWEVQVNDVFTHRESVIATLGRRPSPFQYNPDSPINQVMNNDDVLHKEFGALVFSQLTNGRVAAWVQFPQCDQFASESDEATRVLGIGGAEEWDEARIHRVVGAFFEALAHWEQDTQATDSPSPVGFQINRNEASPVNSSEATE